MKSLIIWLEKNLQEIRKESMSLMKVVASMFNKND
jgi:hypothetical protein